MGCSWSRLPQAKPTFGCDITISDGGEAEMCGNGARCFTRFVNKITGAFSDLRFETPAGILEARADGELVTLAMSAPHDFVLRRILDIGGVKLLSHSVNTGVPHVVTFVDDIESTPVQHWGAQIRYHPAFQPNGTNVNFIKEIEPGKLAIRTYERGVEGETLACGTGVAAAGLIYAGFERCTLSGAPSSARGRLAGGWLSENRKPASRRSL